MCFGLGDRIGREFRALTEQGHAAERERRIGAVLAQQQGRARIGAQILGMLGKAAEQKDWLSKVERAGHQRSVGITSLF